MKTVGDTKRSGDLQGIAAHGSLPRDGQGVRMELRGLADLPVAADVASIGEGVPVVFLHGLVGLNDHWEGVVARAKSSVRCVMLQLPLLDLEDDDCSIDGATELTARFIERVVGERAVLVGNSFGGHVALKIAISRPDLVRGLVLAGSSGLIEKSMVSDIQIRPSRGWLERKIGELFHDRSKMNQADVDRAYETLSNRRQARAMVKLSRSARRNHLGDELHRIQCHTLILWGRQDIVTPPEACEQFAKGIRSNKVMWLEECGHAPMIERPNEFTAALTEYVKSLP